MALTPTQQQFLDAYIRKHAVKGKGKRKRADGFAELRAKALAALAAIPASVAQRADLEAAMASADASGDALKFDRAAAALKQLLQDVAQAAAQHDPGPDIAKLKAQVDEAVRTCKNLDLNVPVVRKFIADHAGLLPLGRPVDEVRDLPDRAGGEDAWLSAVLQLVRQRSADLTQLAARLRSGGLAMDQVKQSALAGARQLQDTEALANDVLKGCRSPQQRDLVSQQMARLRQSLLEPADYAVLRRGRTLDPGDLGAAFDDAYGALEPLLDPVKRKLEALRGAAEALVTQRRPPDAGPDAANKHAGNAALTAQALQDALLAVPAVPRGKPTRGKARSFDQTPVFAGIALGAGAMADAAAAVPATDPRFQDVSTVARNVLKQELTRLQLAADSDEIFDLTMQSAAEFGQAFARAQGWDPKKLTPGQRSMVNAVGAGMFAHARTLCANKLDLNSKTMQLNGQRYGKPKLLAKGGVGAVYRYESETHPGQFIVLKSLLNEDPKARKDMANELRGHRHLMQGQQADAAAVGRNNIVGLQGAVVGSDGSLHMALEMVGGGDMEDNRHALDVASDLGAIPEEVRNLVNQARLKQAVEGLVFMREQNLVHFDIKGANFMLDDDGTVKVADFGSSGLGSDDDGKRDVTSANVGTSGYSPRVPYKEQVDGAYDLHALGKVFEVAHMRASTTQNAQAGEAGHKPLSGALARVVEGMTKSDAGQRSGLEAVLGSSYLQEIDKVDPQALQKVSAASIAYGKALKAEARQVCAGLPDTLLNLAAQRAQLKREDVGFTAVIGAIRLVMEECQVRIAALRAQQAAAGDDAARHDLNAQLQVVQDRLAEHKGYLARFGQSEPTRKLAAQLRQLSEDLLRPQDPPSPEKEAAFLAMLQGSAQRPGEFCSAVSLRSYADILRGWGVDPEHARQLARLYQADISPRNAHALEMLQSGAQSVREILSGVRNDRAKLALLTGFNTMMRALMTQYKAAKERETV